MNMNSPHTHSGIPKALPISVESPRASTVINGDRRFPRRPNAEKTGIMTHS